MFRGLYAIHHPTTLALAYLPNSHIGIMGMSPSNHDAYVGIAMRASLLMRSIRI
jgi:hypothetical protein